MKPSEYLERFERLVVESQIIKISLVKKRRARQFEAYVKVRLTLIDDSVLDVTEYIQAEDEDNAQVKRYSYHWMDAFGQIRVRWDNVRHYPNLPNFPYHQHDGDEKVISSSEPMTLFKVLDFISTQIKR